MCKFEEICRCKFLRIVWTHATTIVKIGWVPELTQFRLFEFMSLPTKNVLLSAFKRNRQKKKTDNLVFFSFRFASFNYVILYFEIFMEMITFQMNSWGIVDISLYFQRKPHRDMENSLYTFSHLSPRKSISYNLEFFNQIQRTMHIIS